jgi:hypothetical protein
MAHPHLSLDSPIAEKIAWANQIYQDHGHHLQRDENVAEHLERLDLAIDDSHREMVASGVAEICRLCDEEEGGSCCGAGIEDRYSVGLLLINRLLRTPLPSFPFSPSSCYFLGETGCRLRARHVLCINFVCKKIADRYQPTQLQALREKEGRELECLFFLNEQVKKALRKDAV